MNNSGNSIFLVDEAGEYRPVLAIPGLEVEFQGKNSKLFIAVGAVFVRSRAIVGNDSFIEIKRTHPRGLNVIIDMKGEGINRSLKIGAGTSIVGARFSMSNESNVSVEIGQNCMLSADVFFIPTDGHAIFDKSTREIINRTRPIKVGDNVWVGKNVILGKGSSVPNFSIIGVGAVVTRKFDEEYTAIAGNPAKVVKRGVCWDRRFIDSFSESGYLVR